MRGDPWGCARRGGRLSGATSGCEVKALSVVMQALTKTLHRTLLDGTNVQASSYFSVRQNYFRTQGILKFQGFCSLCLRGTGSKKRIKMGKKRQKAQQDDLRAARW